MATSTKFCENLANWFDDAMDRIAGAYKRNLKKISLAIGIAVAVILNADPLRVGRALWADPSLRSQMGRGREAICRQLQGAKYPSTPHPCSAAHISRSRSAVQITGHSMPRASS